MPSRNTENNIYRIVSDSLDIAVGGKTTNVVSAPSRRDAEQLIRELDSRCIITSAMDITSHYENHRNILDIDHYV